jgi:hypothetical protein
MMITAIKRPTTTLAGEDRAGLPGGSASLSALTMVTPVAPDYS